MCCLLPTVQESHLCLLAIWQALDAQSNRWERSAPALAGVTFHGRPGWLESNSVERELISNTVDDAPQESARLNRVLTPFSSRYSQNHCVRIKGLDAHNALLERSEIPTRLLAMIPTRLKLRLNYYNPARTSALSSHARLLARHGFHFLAARKTTLLPLSQ